MSVLCLAGKGTSEDMKAGTKLLHCGEGRPIHKFYKTMQKTVDMQVIELRPVLNKRSTQFIIIRKEL